MEARTVLLGFMAMGALTALCVIRGVPMIEADVRNRAIFAAAAVGVGPTLVHVSGRTVILRGESSLAARLQRARDDIAAIAGVRSVTIEFVQHSAPDTTTPRGKAPHLVGDSGPRTR